MATRKRPGISKRTRPQRDSLGRFAPKLQNALGQKVDLDALTRDFDYRVQRQQPDSSEALKWFGGAVALAVLASLAIFFLHR